MSKASRASGPPSARAPEELPTWRQSADELSAALSALTATDRQGRELGVDQAFSRLLRLTLGLREGGGGLFLIGNGASASLASHTAVDLMKNGRIQTRLLHDPAALTAFGNDYSYDEVFSAPLKICLRPGDLLAVISSSGESPSVVNAAYAANRQGVEVLTLTAMKSDNTLRSLGTLNFYLPALSYGLAESGHAAVLHHWIDLVRLAS